MTDDAEKVRKHYSSGYEAKRLESGSGRLERDRTRELFVRFLPPPPAILVDVGGGPGGHAMWLAGRGYYVHLIDVVAGHVTHAWKESSMHPQASIASAEVGDARSLAVHDASADAVLLLGPLYHLTDRADRIQALREAHRVLKPGGVLVAAAISRFASALDGLRSGYLRDPEFVPIVERDLEDGQHRNPTDRPEWFMDTFFHHPDELRAELEEAAFQGVSIYGVEGPGWLLHEFDTWWRDDVLRERLLGLARTLEREPALLGVSAHLMGIGTR